MGINMGVCDMRQIGWAVAVCCCVLAVLPSRLSASGEEYRLKSKDITLNVDTRWAGGKAGGYLPVRIRVTNNGKERELLFRFVPQSNNKLPQVRKRVTVGQNATRQFTLSIPLVSEADFGSYGRLVVSEGGRPLQGLEASISLPEAEQDSLSMPSLLVMSPNKIDCDQFSNAATLINTMSRTPSSGGYIVHPTQTDCEVIEPAMLPDRAIDYSALDTIALSLETFGKLPEGPRAAIINWVRMGGHLIITKAGVPADNSAELNRLLPISGTKGWKPASKNNRRKLVSSFTDEEIQQGFSGNLGHEGFVGTDAETSDRRYVWKVSPDTFAVHRLMLGHVIAFPDNPFPGSVEDWVWLLNSIEPVRDWTWTSRHGISTRRPEASFLEFTIPGVGGVPKLAFIVLISGFTILIGPMNYFFLRRRRQLYLLVVTIPAIAFLTSCSLFAYAAIADGFGVKSRARSFTLLDQRNRSAISLSRFALYAGVAPSDGLRFPEDTAVYPLLPQRREAPHGRWDWDGGQHLAIGWIRSRTPAQFMTVSERTERGRVEFSPGSQPGTLQAANGLEWAIDTLFVVDEQGGLFYGSDLQAGGTTELTSIGPQNLKKRLMEISQAHPFDINSALPARSVYEPYVISASGSLHRSDIDFESSFLERRLKQTLRPISISEFTSQRRMYLAILSESPGLHLGLEKTSPRGDFHVLQGLY